MSVEELSCVAMEIIAHAGSAKSCYLSALQEYKHGAGTAGNEKLQVGDDELLAAHKKHMTLLTEEMTTREPQVSLLLVHAEDQLLNAETIKILVEELQEIYGGQNHE